MDKQLLLILNAQKDFMKSGAVQIDGSEAVIPIINKYIHDEEIAYMVISSISHPRNHISFSKMHGVRPGTIVDGEVRWPNHCISLSRGAELATDLDVDSFTGDTLYTFTGRCPTMLCKSALTDEVKEYIDKCDPDVFIIVGLDLDEVIPNTALDLRLITDKPICIDIPGCRQKEDKRFFKRFQELHDSNINLMFSTSDPRFYYDRKNEIRH